MKIELLGLRLPEVRPGDDLTRLIIEASKDAGGLKEGDILVITSKVVSKAYGLLIKLDEIRPSKKALKIGEKIGEDPRFVQAVLDKSDEILFILPFSKLVEDGVVDVEKLTKNPVEALKVIKKFPCTFFVKRGGQIYSDAGLDSSNHPEGVLSFPPKNPDRIAREIRNRILEYTGIDIPVVISDTEFMPFLGSLDIARGCSGLQVVSRKFGEPDRYGKPKYGGADHIAHELACASALLMGQTDEGIPAVIVRGYRYVRSEEGISDHQLKPAIRIIKEIVKCSVKVLGLKWLLKRALKIVTLKYV